MVVSQNGKLAQPRTSMPPAAGGSINGMKVLMGILLLLIFVGAVTGVVVALSSGQPTIAFVIGLVATAFFARVGC
jgi:cytochrome b subunit of formate dehydrogenase